MNDLKYILVSPTQSVREALECMNQNSKGIVLVVDESNRLLGTVTDGNIRRAILEGIPLEAQLSNLIGTDPTYPNPVTANEGASPSELLALLREYQIHQIPLLDGDRRVVDLVTVDDLTPKNHLPVTAVVMAGGLGTRLRPLTNETPKPMLPVGGRPLMEHIIEGLREVGITQVNVTTHYKPEVITNHFGDGTDFGVSIEYVAEEQPLGTAGALGLLDVSAGPRLVINGDILTKVDYRAMLAFHRENEADLTIGVRGLDVKVPYGVVETNGATVRKLKEKPVISFFVNAGIYLLDPGVSEFIPNGQHMDMTDLIQKLLLNERQVISFPISEYWIDIGQREDYDQALLDLATEGT